MRILILGNAPWCPSGYGEQIGLLAPRLKALGHEVAIAANHGLQGTIMFWHDMPVYPAIHPNHDLGHIAADFNADIVLTLLDSWTLHPNAWPDDMRVAAWTPIDHYPIPPKVGAVLQHEKVQPIAMSRFGEMWMKKLDPLYAPHAIDTEVFRPLTREVRNVVRDGMEIGHDDFLIGVVGANRGWNPHVCRKSFTQMLQAFAEFLPSHEDAWLYMHTESVPRGGMGTDLLPLIMALDAASPGKLIDRVRFPSDRELLFGLPRAGMAQQYAAYDVLLHPSMSEGFGVPIIESQACGIPVIVSDHSSMTELCGAGWLVAGDPWWDSLQDSFAFMPHLQSIYSALEAAYAARGDQQLRDKAVEFTQGYDIDPVIADYWMPALEKLAEPREVEAGYVVQERKKERKKQAAERRKVTA